MRIDYLTPEQAEEVDGLLKGFLVTNKELKWSTFPMDAPTPTTVGEISQKELQKKIEDLQKSLDALNAKIDRIFGDYFLVPTMTVNIGKVGMFKQANDVLGKTGE